MRSVKDWTKAHEFLLKTGGTRENSTGEWSMLEFFSRMFSLSPRRIQRCTVGIPTAPTDENPNFPLRDYKRALHTKQMRLLDEQANGVLKGGLHEIETPRGVSHTFSPVKSEFAFDKLVFIQYISM